MCYTLLFFFFFFNDTATTEIYTLSLHDALPISSARCRRCCSVSSCAVWRSNASPRPLCSPLVSGSGTTLRSEEHTSELQSRSDLVCRLLLEKKKNKKSTAYTTLNNLSCIPQTRI